MVRHRQRRAHAAQSRRIDVAPVRADTSTPRAATVSTMSALGRRLPRRAGSREPPREPNFRKPGSAQRPRGPGVHPFAFARLRMAVSERLCWRPIQARLISDRLRGVGQALITSRANRGAAALTLACEWPCPRGCAGARSQALAISDRFRGVGQALIASRTRARTAERNPRPPRPPPRDALRGPHPAWRRRSSRRIDHRPRGVGQAEALVAGLGLGGFGRFGGHGVVPGSTAIRPERMPSANDWASVGGAELGQQHRRRPPQRIDVAPVRADHPDPRAAATFRMEVGPAPSARACAGNIPAGRAWKYQRGQLLTDSCAQKWGKVANLGRRSGRSDVLLDGPDLELHEPGAPRFART
jgi:hypothetical protein